MRFTKTEQIRPGEAATTATWMERRIGVVRAKEFDKDEKKGKIRRDCTVRVIKRINRL
ncbi:hypothetical protein ADA01nite_06710 [Aneurinibacillus danicus]|uniref:Uncharacterized protein n=1 Tax=Aneurinibacillus danicus TaxID=267746 RepID=A0A511V531_9BACL|nr:hypothetical protein ADA01nite_06710 [Aneurinibacillus danicus]